MFKCSCCAARWCVLRVGFTAPRAAGRGIGTRLSSANMRPMAVAVTMSALGSACGLNVGAWEPITRRAVVAGALSGALLPMAAHASVMTPPDSSPLLVPAWRSLISDRVEHTRLACMHHLSASGSNSPLIPAWQSLIRDRAK